MPSREEITRWLRQAGEFDLRYTAQPNGEPSLLGIEGKKVWEDRAAKVENLRCENCTVGKDLAMIPSTSNPNPVKREKPDIFCPRYFTLFPAGHYCGEFTPNKATNDNPKT